MSKIGRTEKEKAPIKIAHFEEGEDRRLKGERINVSFPVYLTLKGSLVQGYTQAINLSWSGIMIITNFPLNVSDKVGLEFTLPGQHIPISAKAKVIHRHKETAPEEATELGLVFEGLEPNIQRMLSGYVLENIPD